MASHYDVIVIGTGFSGLSAAKTYVQLEPTVRLLVLDEQDSIGGVWAKERLYPGLRSNNQLGTFEFPDFPMHEGFGVKKEEHIPGHVLHEYLRQYAEKFGLTQRIQLRRKVKSAEKVALGWSLQVVPIEPDKTQTSTKIISCTKLIVATGLTYSPRPIHIVGSENSTLPIVPFASLPHQFLRLRDDPSIKHITVVGSGKATYDTAYLFATAGKSVTWVIRKSGHGPNFMAAPHIYIGPLRCWLEKLVTTRFLTWFSPCLWGDADGFGYVRSLLHQTRIGRWVVDRFWDKLEFETLQQSGYTKHADLKGLIPDNKVFWYASNVGILNYPTNVLDLVVEGRIEVLRKDIDRIEEGNRVKFTDGTSIATDVLIPHMGWKVTPGIEFLPTSIHDGLGIPSNHYSAADREKWDRLNARADLEILQRFPKLAEGPRLNLKPSGMSDDLPHLAAGQQQLREELTPWRLFRGLVPPAWKERNIAFCGMMINLQGAIRSEIAGIWVYAYLNDKLQWPVTMLGGVPTTEPARGDDELLYETALFNRFGMWRTPYGFGWRYPDFVFDGIPFFDLLLHDLGLRRWRKGWGWLGEVFGGGYSPSDYIGLTDEWKQNQIKSPGEEAER